MSGANYVFWMHFVVIRAWNYSKMKNNSKSVRKKVCLLKLVACAWWWMQMVCDPQRANGLSGVPWAHNPSTATSCLETKTNTITWWGKKRRKGDSPVNVIYLPIHVPQNILSCPCCNFLAALYMSFPVSRSGLRTHRHTDTSSFSWQLTLRLQAFNAPPYYKILSYRDKSSKKKQAANSLFRFSNLQNLLLNLPFCWNLQAILNLNFSTH